LTEVVALRPRLDSAAAVALAGTLKEHSGRDVSLDAAEVSLLGALALQTLVVAAASWRGAGLGFSLVNVPEAIERQIADLGCADLTLDGETP